MNPASLPHEDLRCALANVGIARERHRLAELMAMLPARVDGRPYEGFDADCVAEVLVYLVGAGVIEVPRTSVKARHEIAALAYSDGRAEQLKVLDYGHDAQLA